jgi:hypothetical protein
MKENPGLSAAAACRALKIKSSKFYVAKSKLKQETKRYNKSLVKMTKITGTKIGIATNKETNNDSVFVIISKNPEMVAKTIRELKF